MKQIITSILLCCSLSGFQQAYSYYNTPGSNPFVDMMIAMMNAMTGSSGSYYNPSQLGLLPYSPITGVTPGLGAGGLPMSPANNIPFANNFPAASSITNAATDPFSTLNPSTPGINDAKSTSNSNSLNGIWQATSGDIMAIYHNNYFIWSDGNTRNLAGRLIIRGNEFIAYFPMNKSVLHFQFYQANNQFIVRTKAGKVYTFNKIH